MVLGFLGSMSPATRLEYRLDLDLAPDLIDSAPREVRRIVEKRLEAVDVQIAEIRVPTPDTLHVVVSSQDPEVIEDVRQYVERQGRLRFQVVHSNTPPKLETDCLERKEGEYDDALFKWAASYRKWRSGRSDGPPPARPEAPKYIARRKWERQNPEEGLDSPLVPTTLMVLENEPRYIVHGSDIESANLALDMNGLPALAFVMTSEGARRLSALTGTHFGRQLASVFDERILQAPSIKDRITSDGIVTGRFTEEEVDSMVMLLEAGSLPVPLVHESTVDGDTEPFRL